MAAEPGEGFSRGALLRTMRRAARRHYGVGRRQAKAADFAFQPVEVRWQHLSNARGGKLLAEPLGYVSSIVRVVAHVMRAPLHDTGPLQQSAEADHPVKHGGALVALQIVDAVEAVAAQQPR